MSFVKKSTVIIFFLHLVLVLAFGAIVVMSYDTSPHAQNEAQLLWFIFYAIDFPLGFLFTFVGRLFVFVFPFFPSDNYYLDNVVLPGCAFQILGWINWTMIWTLGYKLYERCFRR